MKKYLVLLMVLLLPVATMQGKKKEKQNIMVWGEVNTADDGNGYLTMYKNCPAEITAQFHFVYFDKTKSIMYDLFMPDTVSQVYDPVPVEKPVKEVVVENIIYSTIDAEGKKYSTSDPDDPILAMLLVDLFDFYHDLFWFDVIHRANYYHGRHYDDWTPSSSRYNKSNKKSNSKSKDVDLDKIDDTAILVGAATVALASVFMIVDVINKWDIKDDRFPYVSFSPQLQYFFQTGTIRDVVQMKVRLGNKGGISFMGDIGYATGSLNHPDVFNPGLTWSLGFGLEDGAFSMSFHGKPATDRYAENFFIWKLGYDVFVTKNLALDLGLGVGLFKYDGSVYADVPLSLGLLWKF